MLLIEPPQEKVQFTFFNHSYHHQFYLDDEPEEPNPLSRKAQVAKYSHPREEEEIDHFFFLEVQS